MLDIALYQPEIPPNTGNVIRLCANAGARLHLIHPLGFALDDRRLRRAGLDYHEYANVREHEDGDAFLAAFSEARILACSTRGDQPYHEVRYRSGDVLLFGPETRGLPQPLLERLPPAQRLRIPMRPHSRCLNLSNAVAVVVFEAWRQLGFIGGR